MTAGREPFAGKLAGAFEGGIALGVEHFEADIELWDWVPLGARASFPEARSRGCSCCPAVAWSP